MKKITLLLAILCTSLSFSQIVINELDADQTSTDVMEFIELEAAPNTSLDGFIVVLFNGNNELSYTDAIDLTGFSTDADGFFIIGGDMVPGADITLGESNVIQNGADAVAIYQAAAAQFPSGTAATTAGLIDAIVYGTNDADDAELLAALGETTQYNEDANNNNADTESLQRADDGTYCTGLPTLRATNVDCGTTCPLNVFVVSVTCDAVTDGVDTYTTTLNFTGGGTATYVVSSTEGSVSGDNPSTDADGEIIISGVNEGVDFDYSVVGGNCDITNTINATLCEPAGEVDTIAALRASEIGGEYTLTGEAFITFQQEFRNQKFIQDQTAAILIDDSPGNITTMYNIGDGISGISGTLSEFQGMLQFQVNADPGAATSTGNTINPESVTVAQLTANPNDYESELVVLEIANIDTSENDIWVVGTEYPMTENGTGDAYIFRTSFFDVDYIDEQVIPEGFVTGIITERNDGDYFITARSGDDFSPLANVTENGIEGFSIAPNPASTTVSFKASNAGAFDIAVYDVLGKEVLNATAVQTLNVQALTSGIYLVKATQNGISSVAKLVIE